MKVAVVHPHFRRGGVTRVVENAIRSLADHGVEVLALSGEKYQGDALPHHRVVPGLGYDDQPEPLRSIELARDLRLAAREVFGGAPDLWHVHNHSLGKNLHLPGALRHLARNGAHLLLQIHDFAEDGRPDNFSLLRQTYPESGTFSGALYPDAPNIHYAALNGRDASILRQAGVPDERCHLLPNPVAIPSLTADTADPLPKVENLILYPTRAIRRKNVGEMLLHAALANPGTLFATTLRPENPIWSPIHKAWERTAKRLKLPVAFGLGEEHAFDALMRRADALLTTSVAEGFGLAFLEPALFGKPLVGRNLPAITDDFRAWGVALDHLYPSLSIPARHIDEAAVAKRVASALGRLGEAYARPVAPDAAERALASMRTAEGGWDFGRLDEGLQTAVIEAALEHPGDFSAISDLAATAPDPAFIANQAEAISAHLNLETYGEKLAKTYRALAASPTEEPGTLAAESILDAFLDPATLSLLRS